MLVLVFVCFMCPFSVHKLYPRFLGSFVYCYTNWMMDYSIMIKNNDQYFYNHCHDINGSTNIYMYISNQFKAKKNEVLSANFQNKWGLLYKEQIVYLPVFILFFCRWNSSYFITDFRPCIIVNFVDSRKSKLQGIRAHHIHETI